MSALTIAPISVKEFTGMMQAIGPVSFTRWSKTLAVANSGGADSTCLLYLLNEYNKELPPKKKFKTLSLTIDHDLQSTSAQMAESAANFAKSLEVEHVTIKIPWGEGIYPPKPASRGNERLARDARYAALFANMRDAQIGTLALAHHVDDQVETMLMRMGKGTTKLGLIGMQPRSRFGMGTDIEGLNWRGHLGLLMYKIRPLLDVGKDRILATCEANKLEYVNDPTNFQPQFTIRNAIRHCIDRAVSGGAKEFDEEFTEYTPEVATQLKKINKEAAKYTEFDNISLKTGREELREAVKKVAKELEEVDATVDKFLLEHRKPTAPGTLMVSIPPLLEITSPIVRQALILRILRYVSYEPWGSIRSELGRRQKSVKRLMQVLWDAQGVRSRKNISFTVGSGVWWKPSFVTKGHILRTAVKDLDFNSLMWFASRHPSINNPTAPVSDNLRIVMTEQLRDGRTAWEAGQGPDALEILFDRRFLIRFQLDKMPEDVIDALHVNGGVVIKKRSPWHLPEVVFKQNKIFTVIHTQILREKFTWEREWGTKTYIDTNSDWITIQYVRPISSL